MSHLYWEAGRRWGKPIRVAFLAPYYPLPIRSGGHTRITNLAAQLADRHQIHWLSFTDAQDGEHLPKMPGLASPPVLVHARANRRCSDKLSEAVRPSRLSRTVSRAAGLLGALPIDAVRMKDPRLARALGDLLRAHSIDIVQIEYGAMAAYLPLIRQISPSIKIVIDELEVSSVVITRRMEFEPRPPSWFSSWDARRWARFERRIWSQSDAVLAMSELECDVVNKKAGSGKGHVVPNGVDVEYFRPVTRAVDDSSPQRLLFVGNLEHRPNAEGLAVFLDTAWPTLTARFPELELHVVGPAPADEPLQLRASQRVTFHGYVDDVRPHLAAAIAAIVPIVTGGGTRLKVLEALAAGTPVVSTKLGVEGLAIRDRHEALLTDSIAEFPDAVGTLLAKPEQRSGLSLAGRRLVEERYGWASISDTLEGIWLGLQDRSRSLRSA